MMKIAIDGMGGDNAPAEIVSGVIKAMEEFKDIEFYITGPEDAIKRKLLKITIVVIILLLLMLRK